MATEPFQNVVIGSGEAGKYMAWTLAEMGQKTIVVERGAIGGACPNVACLPTKNVIHSAKVASVTKHGAAFGVATGPIRIDMPGVQRRKAQMVEALQEVHRKRFQASGAELLFGEARFIEPKTFQVTSGSGTRTLRGDRVFLAVGTRAGVPPVPGLADTRPLTHVEALDLQRLPEHLVILGGGYVGLEFAQALRRFGSRVTVIEHNPQLLAREDADVASAIAQLMKDEGIEILVGTDVTNVQGRSGEQVQLQIKAGTNTSTLQASDILVAAGRTCNADRLDAAKGGVELNPRGYIKVNDRLETTAADTWAMGDCAGSPMFTHVSLDDFRIVRDNLAGGQRSTRDRLIPFNLFTDPELARVGLNEAEARAKKIPYRLATAPMAAVLRTRTHSETRGFLKALVGDDDRLLGFTAFGVEASELMVAAQMAMLGNMTYTAVRDTIFAHPTAAEGLGVLFGKPLQRPG